MPGSPSIRSSTVAKPGRCETFLRPLLGEVNSGARAIRGLAVAVVGLGLQIKSKGYGPFVMGLVSVATILPGKFLIGSNLTTYTGASGDRLGLELGSKVVGGFRFLLDVRALG